MICWNGVCEARVALRVFDEFLLSIFRRKFSPMERGVCKFSCFLTSNAFAGMATLCGERGLRLIVSVRCVSITKVCSCCARRKRDVMGCHPRRVLFFLLVNRILPRPFA